MDARGSTRVQVHGDGSTDVTPRWASGRRPWFGLAWVLRAPPPHSRSPASPSRPLRPSVPRNGTDGRGEKGGFCPVHRVAVVALLTLAGMLLGHGSWRAAGWRGADGFLCLGGGRAEDGVGSFVSLAHVPVPCSRCNRRERYLKPEVMRRAAEGNKNSARRGEGGMPVWDPEKAILVVFRRPYMGTSTSDSDRVRTFLWAGRKRPAARPALK